MRAGWVVLWLLAAAAVQASPQATLPFEITKDHIDVEVFADGSYADSHEEIFRVLNAQGVQLMQERQFSYTQDYETMDVKEAYTLKANGTRIDVPKGSYLSGFGQTSMPGFQDLHIVSLFYPNLEVGDQIVLVTVHRQLKPWFAGRFDMRSEFGRGIAMHDIRYAVTAPDSLKLNIDTAGMDGGVPEAAGDKKRWTWEFHNDVPMTLESDAISEDDISPHVRITSYANYAEVARSYRDQVEDRAQPTPEISTLADDLTKGVTDKRGQAKILYDWVSSHIGYVEIVLGNGGFVPHRASAVLSNRFGDCKDHVVLLEALLAAKGIASTAVLIRVATATYKLPDAASPHNFDHVITYVPAFDLYLDSTAQIAPFGVLPYTDGGKPVVLVSTGALARTPVPSSLTSTVRANATVKINPDGSADGSTKISGTGAYGMLLRGFMQAVPAGKENDLFRNGLGPGADGTLDRGDPHSLNDPSGYSATYHVPNAIVFPGTGSLPPHLAFKPFFFTELVGGSLPAVRSSDYICVSVDAEETTKFTLPPGMKLISIPDSQAYDVDQIRLHVDYDRPEPRALNVHLSLKVDHPQATCSAEYYARVHGALTKMSNALRQQIVYKSSSENAR